MEEHGIQKAFFVPCNPRGVQTAGVHEQGIGSQPVGSAPPAYSYGIHLCLVPGDARPDALAQGSQGQTAVLQKDPRGEAGPGAGPGPFHYVEILGFRERPGSMLGFQSEIRLKADGTPFLLGDRKPVGEIRVEGPEAECEARVTPEEVALRVDGKLLGLSPLQPRATWAVLRISVNFRDPLETRSTISHVSIRQEGPLDSCGGL